MYTDDQDYLPPSSLAGTKLTKSGRITERLRNQIIKTMRPDARLASFNEMEETFGVSRTVLREAVNSLKREGFISALDRQGLFVSGNPPHLSRFALVFPNNPSSPEWPRFYTALQNEAAGFQRERDNLEFVSFYDVSAGPGTDGYEKLVAAAQAHQLAGLMLLPCNKTILDGEPFRSLPVPKIYIFGSKNENRVPSVTTDDFSLADRMVQWLHDRGRQRLAFVTVSGTSRTLQGHLREKNIPSPSHWFQRVARDSIADVREVVTLLMDYPADRRPDGLAILDDNLTEHAIGGLFACGLQIGQDLDVIAHCNWPWPVPSPVPIQRIGYHARHILKLSVRGIELERQHLPLAIDQARVPALFEHEIDQHWDATSFDPKVEDKSTSLA